MHAQSVYSSRLHLGNGPVNSFSTMSTRSTNLRRPSGTLSIFPPSPSAAAHPTITTPTNPTTFSTSISSPRRAPLPPSPNHSTYSSSDVPWLDARPRGNSFDVPPVPGRSEKRSGGPPSPHRKDGKGGYAGAYDNKLVRAVLSSARGDPSQSPMRLARHGVKLNP